MKQAFQLASEKTWRLSNSILQKFLEFLENRQLVKVGAAESKDCPFKTSLLSSRRAMLTYSSLYDRKGLNLLRSTSLLLFCVDEYLFYENEYASVEIQLHMTTMLFKLLVTMEILKLLSTF